MSAGQQLLSGRHQCPAEVVEPKCAELQRVCTILNQRLERRLHTLAKCRELMENIEKVTFFFNTIHTTNNVSPLEKKVSKKLFSQSESILKIFLLIL